MANSFAFQELGTKCCVKYDRKSNKSIINCSAAISLTTLNLKSEPCNFDMKELIEYKIEGYRDRVLDMYMYVMSKRYIC